MFKIDFNKFAEQTLGDIGDILVKEAQGNMDKVSHGKVYVVGGKAHIASKAGDTANNLSGELRKTIRHEAKGKILEFGAGNGKVNYAKYLELGTKKMGKRPNYTKTILENKKKIDAKIRKNLKSVVRWVA